MQYEYETARQREDVRLAAVEVIDVHHVQHMPPEERGIIQLRGELRANPEAAYAYLQPRLRALGYTPLLQEDENDPDMVVLLAMPGHIDQSPARLRLPLILFVLTILSTFMTGGVTIDGFDWRQGVGFSLAILSILLAHEMGHFLMARRMGVQVSYPFFIPMPLTPIGTMGAVIAMKSPPPNRSALLAVAIAGPVAGLVIAIPVLLYGLSISQVNDIAVFEAQVENRFAEMEPTWLDEWLLDNNLVDEIEPQPVYLLEGNSLIYAGAKILVFGRFLPDGQQDVNIHMIAFAGWVGLLVTGLNLLPAGQLDGGHIFYALFGRRLSRRVTWGIAGMLFLLGFLWVGWFLWAFLIVIFGQNRAPMLNELTPLSQRQRMIAIAGLILFVLVFTPVPFQIIEL